MAAAPETTPTAAAAIPTPTKTKENTIEEIEEREEKDYSLRLKTLSEKGLYEFEYVEGPKAGQRVQIQRFKISNRMMQELEEDRAEYASIVTKFRNSAAGPTREERLDAAKKLTGLYAKLAKCYFHIEREEFDNMDWDSTKPNIDAAANVSVRGRPNVV